MLQTWAVSQMLIESTANSELFYKWIRNTAPARLIFYDYSYILFLISCKMAAEQFTD